MTGAPLDPIFVERIDLAKVAILLSFFRRRPPPALDLAVIGRPKPRPDRGAAP